MTAISTPHSVSTKPARGPTTVRFNTAGLKKLLAKYARLEPA
ncbi:MAG: hypothetical protein WD690_16345 [Vicinamibacterales bacterium]